MTRRRCTMVGAEMLTGAALLLEPAAVLSRVGPGDATADACTVARLLGARQVTQALLLAVRPSSNDLELAAAIDATHCASMLVLARISARYRQAAMTSALVAVMFCAWELWASSKSSVTVSASQR